MTTYLLLALSDDGSSRAYVSKRGELFGLDELPEIKPTATRDDVSEFDARNWRVSVAFDPAMEPANGKA